MCVMTFETLTEAVPAGIFDCGVPDINEKIYGSYYQHLLNQVKVYQIKLDGLLVGYLSISVVGVSLHQAEGEIADYSDGNSFFGALQLNFIAIDKELQGNGIGKAAMYMLIQKTQKYASKLPIRVIKLDAINPRVEWYQKRGFKYINPGQEEGSFTKAMYLDIMEEDQKHLIEDYCEKNMG